MDGKSATSARPELSKAAWLKIASSVLPSELFKTQVITTERPIKPTENSTKAMVARGEGSIRSGLGQWSKEERQVPQPPERSEKEGSYYWTV